MMLKRLLKYLDESCSSPIDMVCRDEKSRIRETKHLSTDADSSTDAIGGWTKAKSAKKTIFFCAAILEYF